MDEHVFYMYGTWHRSRMKTHLRVARSGEADTSKLYMLEVQTLQTYFEGRTNPLYRRQKGLSSHVNSTEHNRAYL